MFIGEALCLAAFVIKRNMSRPEQAREKSQGVFTNSIYFSIPATLDMCGTGVMNAGLCLTYASVFQMLRSAVVVFTALMSILILKRKLYAFHWVSIFFVCLGVFVVGYVSIAETDDSSSNTKPASSVMLGNFLVIVAQFMVAVQMVVEEKIITKYGAPALKAVGFEGIFGFIILSIMLVPLYYISVSGGEHDYPLEVRRVLGISTSCAGTFVYNISATNSDTVLHAINITFLSTRFARCRTLSTQ